jgi:hypothetical protein
MNQPTDALHLVFDAKTLDYIATVLGQRPYAEVAPVLANISQQIAAQQQSKGPLAGPQEALNGSGATETPPIQ